MSQPTTRPSSPLPNFQIPSFDQVVKGNVDIKKSSKNNYQIKISEISKFLLYQVWSSSSKTLNEERSVYYQKANKWITNFNSLNTSLKASDKPLFTPTTVMEIGLKKYLFVIHKAKLNGKGHVVFKVSTKEIKLSDKKMLKLPCGHHDGVRFDIDDNAGGCDNNVFPIPQDTSTLFNNTWTQGPTEWIFYIVDGTCSNVVALKGQSSPCLVKSTEVTNLVNTYGLTSGYLGYINNFIYAGVLMSNI